MIIVRRAHERCHVSRRKHDAWLTFFPEDEEAALARGFGVLVILTETRLAPNAGVSLAPHPDAEVVTYVLEGSVAYSGPMGSSGVLRAGEFRRMSAGRRLRCREANELPNDWVHFFRIGLGASEAAVPAPPEQKRFPMAERQGVLCTIASPDGRGASLRVHQDALLFSGVLEPGHHVTHELLPERGAWVHVVRGEVRLGDLILRTGDGAGITAERAVSLTARERSEVLLADLRVDAPVQRPNGAAQRPFF